MKIKSITITRKITKNPTTIKHELDIETYNDNDQPTQRDALQMLAEGIQMVVNRSK